MLDFGFYNMDCMEGMKEFPDKYFDLAIVDPPYGGGSQTVQVEREKGCAVDAQIMNKESGQGLEGCLTSTIYRTGGTWATERDDNRWTITGLLKLTRFGCC